MPDLWQKFRLLPQERDTFLIPLLSTLCNLVAQPVGSGDPRDWWPPERITARGEHPIDIVESLLSVKVLTVLQLVGFNYKQAIGQPLTLLLQKFITSKIPLDAQSALENNKLTAAHNMELMKIAQDQEAFERWMQLRN